MYRVQLKTTTRIYVLLHNFGLFLTYLISYSVCNVHCRRGLGIAAGS